MRTAALAPAGLLLFAAMAGCSANPELQVELLNGTWYLDSEAPGFTMELKDSVIVEINGKLYNETITADELLNITFSFGDGYTFTGRWEETSASYIGTLTYNGQLVDELAQFSPAAEES